MQPASELWTQPVPADMWKICLNDQRWWQHLGGWAWRWWDWWTGAGGCLSVPGWPQTSEIDVWLNPDKAKVEVVTETHSIGHHWCMYIHWCLQNVVVQELKQVINWYILCCVILMQSIQKPSQYEFCKDSSKELNS